MESVARRAGVSRATVYLHWKSKQELFRALVQQLHDQHIAEMQAAIEKDGLSLEQRLIAVLEARFLRFVELASSSAHAAELYDLHSKLCGDIAKTSQQRSEKLLTALLRDEVAAGAADLDRCGLSAGQVAAVLFDCAHGAKGEDPSLATPAEFQRRLRRTVRVLVSGLGLRS